MKRKQLQLKYKRNVHKIKEDEELQNQVTLTLSYEKRNKKM